MLQKKVKMKQIVFVFNIFFIYFQSFCVNIGTRNEFLENIFSRTLKRDLESAL